MPKRRSKKPANNSIEKEYRDLDDTVDPEDEDYMYDAVEKFHNRKEQRILGKFEQKSDDESSDEEEEILPVGDDNDDDSDDAEEQEKENYDDDDDESLEDDESEEEEDSDDDDGDYDGSDDDNLPGVSSSKAWGKKRSTYYGADKLDGLEGFDRDEAQDQEEAEALKIQKRLMKEIDVTKFTTFKKKTQEKQKQSAKEDESKDDKDEEGEKVEVDVASLSLEEQHKLVKQLHPEVEPLLQNFEVYWAESRKLRRMVKLMNKKPGKFGAKVSAFVKGRFKLCSFYCMYISHYISIIARKASLKGHEILTRLTECIKLLNEGEKEYKRLEVQIDWALKPEQKHLFEAASDSDDSEMEVETDSTLEPPRRRHRRDVTATSSKLKSLQDDIDEKEQEEKDEEDNDDDDNDESRRGVNRQIEKNVGLKPKKSLKRRQMERNPRVKHREKFRRAAIRRKGQVRPHRPEINKYTGEQSGIREGIIRSIKLKS